MDDKHAKYQKAGLGRRIGFGERPAILIVDFNKGCVAKDSPLPPLMDLDDQVAYTRTLIDLARKSGTLIYRVIIPQECVGDRTADVHEASLFDMNAKNADVVPVAEAEAYFHKAAAAAYPELRTQLA